jgi:peptidoglycan/LPS O-acetylase OafA/YrhL
LSALTVARIAIPLGIKNPRGDQNLSLTARCLFPFYFAAIGIAFMFVEIAFILRFSLFMGHPTYGFTVVLAGLLMATGLGSFASARFSEKLNSYTWSIFLMLAVVLWMAEKGSALALAILMSKPEWIRIVVGLGLIIPPAFLMQRLLHRSSQRPCLANVDP